MFCRKNFFFKTDRIRPKNHSGDSLCLIQFEEGEGVLFFFFLSTSDFPRFLENHSVRLNSLPLFYFHNSQINPCRIPFPFRSSSLSLTFFRTNHALENCLMFHHYSSKSLQVRKANSQVHERLTPNRYLKSVVFLLLAASNTNSYVIDPPLEAFMNTVLGIRKTWGEGG